MKAIRSHSFYGMPPACLHINWPGIDDLMTHSCVFCMLLEVRSSSPDLFGSFYETRHGKLHWVSCADTCAPAVHSLGDAQELKESGDGNQARGFLCCCVSMHNGMCHLSKHLPTETCITQEFSAMAKVSAQPTETRHFPGRQ